ncbi:MAG: DNA polymerase III subunit delta [Candidatus Methylomirabilaceae bacterium]
MAGRIGTGEIAPVYCLYGEDSYRLEQALRQLLDSALPEGARDLNLDQVRPGDAETASILGSARTVPFLATRRVVLVRDADALSEQQREEVLAYLDAPCPTSCLVLVATRLDLRTRLAAALQKKGVVLRFDQLEPGSMKEALQAAALERQKRVSPEAIDLLIALAGDDLRQSISGLEKAALFVGERGEIGHQDIEELVGATRVRSIFQLTDAVGSQDLETALGCLGNLLAHGEEPLPIIGMLARQIRLLLRAKALREQETPSSEFARRLGVPPRVGLALAEQGASLRWEQLRSALEGLCRADLALKTGRAAGPAVLHRLVWDLCGV